MYQINTAGLTLIKAYEGFRSYPYRDSAGVRTIGYGHTKGVTAYSTPVTEEEAEELLKADLSEAQGYVEQFITAPLNENQYSALVSLVFNTGIAPLQGTLGHLLNAREYNAAAEEFQRWVYANGEEIQGLIRRRAAEKALFLMPIT